MINLIFKFRQQWNVKKIMHYNLMKWIKLMKNLEKNVKCITMKLDNKEIIVVN